MMEPREENPLEGMASQERVSLRYMASSVDRPRVSPGPSTIKASEEFGKPERVSFA